MVDSQLHGIADVLGQVIRDKASSEVKDGLSRRYATVSQIKTDGTLVVKPDGSTDNVLCGRACNPKVGDRVVILVDGTQWVAVGTVGGDGGGVSLPESITDGGTGQTTVAAARNALGLGNTAGALPAANGGTGMTTTPYCPFPVNGIYMSMVSTNPNTIWTGTTWSAIASGRVLVGVQTTDTDFNTVNKSGGSKTHLHGLDAGCAYLTTSGNQMHFRYKSVATWQAQHVLPSYYSGYGSSTYFPDATTLGGTTDNATVMPPYLTCYIWRRTA